MSDFLKPREASQLAGVTIKTLARWDRKGALSNTMRTPSGQRRYLVSDILSILNIGFSKLATKRKPGVYCIYNKTNCKRYVGSTIDLVDRELHHFSLLKGGIHYNTHLQMSFDKYGINAFEFQVLLYCAENELYRLEKYYIDYFSTTDIQKGYNIKPDPYRHRHAEETKRKISNSLKGHAVSDLTRGKQSQAKMGNKIRLGMKHSLAAKQKMSNKLTGRKRGPHSPETIEKIRRSNKGQRRSKEAREHMRQARLNYLKTHGKNNADT